VCDAFVFFANLNGERALRDGGEKSGGARNSTACSISFIRLSPATARTIASY